VPYYSNNQPDVPLEQNTTPKLPWVKPELVVLDVKLINQQAMDQEAELLNYLATDENAFKLFTGSTGR